MEILKKGFMAMLPSVSTFIAQNSSALHVEAF